jgi:hypothetical protein
VAHEGPGQHEDAECDVADGAEVEVFETFGDLDCYDLCKEGKG